MEFLLANGWIKYFSDGSSCTGWDHEMNVSWRNSRNNDIIKVDLVDGATTCSIKGSGEYWQTDNFELDLQKGTTKRVSRAIQKRLSLEDIIMYVINTKENLIVSFLPVEGSVGIPLSQQHIGKWISLEIVQNSKSVSLRYFFANDRLI